MVIVTAKGAHLYTPKTQEKLDIFLNVSRPLNTVIWIGMNHMAKAYVFLWDDDGSIYSGTPNVFIKGNVTTSFYVLTFE